MTNPFTCDSNAKLEVGSILDRYLSENLNRTVITAVTDDYEPVDILVTSITTDNRCRKCAIEMKERSYCTVFDPEFVNVEKRFDGYRSSGYTILWVAYYPKADRLIVWDYDRTDRKKLGNFNITRHTVLNDGRIPQERWGVNVSDAILDIKPSDLITNAKPS